jgi:hypothetical protein
MIAAATTLADNAADTDDALELAIGAPGCIAATRVPELLHLATFTRRPAELKLQWQMGPLAAIPKLYVDAYTNAKKDRVADKGASKPMEN